MLGYDTRTLSRHRKDKILEEQDYCCAYCFGPADEVDHIIPWSYSHDDSDENLVACCWLCNRIASDKVFRNLSIKRDHIQKRREVWIKHNVIPLWLRSEVQQLGRKLKMKVFNECVVCEDMEELVNVRRRLLAEGLRVADGATALRQRMWIKMRKEEMEGNESKL